MLPKFNSRLSAPYIEKEWKRARAEMNILSDDEPPAFPFFPRDLPVQCEPSVRELPPQIVEAATCSICTEVIHAKRNVDICAFMCGHSVCTACANRLFTGTRDAVRCGVTGCGQPLRAEHYTDVTELVGDSLASTRCQVCSSSMACCLFETRCKHYVCCNCKKEAFSYRLKKASCMYCRKSVTQKEIRHEKFIKSLVTPDLVIIKCPSPGCEFSGLQSQVETHFRFSCDGAYRLCPQGCMHFVVGRDMELHLESECEYVTSECKGCKRRLTRTEAVDHEDECSGALVECPYGCTDAQNPSLRFSAAQAKQPSQSQPRPSPQPLSQSQSRSQPVTATEVVVGRPIGTPCPLTAVVATPPPLPLQAIPQVYEAKAVEPRPFLVRRLDLAAHAVVCPCNQFKVRCPYYADSGCRARFKSATSSEYTDHVVDVLSHIHCARASCDSRILPNGDGSLETLLGWWRQVCRRDDVKESARYFKTLEDPIPISAGLLGSGEALMMHLEYEGIGSIAAVCNYRRSAALNYMRKFVAVVYLAARTGNEGAKALYDRLTAVLGSHRLGSYGGSGGSGRASYTTDTDLANITFLRFIECLCTNLKTPDLYLYVYASILVKGDIVEADPVRALKIMYPVFRRNPDVGGVLVINTAMRLCDGYRDTHPNSVVVVEDVVSLMARYRHGESECFEEFKEHLFHVVSVHMADVYSDADLHALWAGKIYDHIDYFFERTRYRHFKLLPVTIASCRECQVEARIAREREEASS